MKLLVLSLVTFAASSSFASEVKVLDLPASKAAGANVHSRFTVNNVNGNAGVSITLTKHRGGPRASHPVARTYHADVPELSLAHGKLYLTLEGKAFECGVMGESRFLRRPTLYLTGACKLKEKRVSSDAGRRFQVFVVTE